MANQGCKKIDEEVCSALKDVKECADDYGFPVRFLILNEGDIVRDNYGSIKRKTPSEKLDMNANPVQPTPTERQYELAGIHEKVDAIIYTASLDWSNAGYDINDIDIVRTQCEYDRGTYEIVDKNTIGQIGSTWLYFVFGIVKR
jgi:hypothetical protein